MFLWKKLFITHNSLHPILVTQLSLWETPQALATGGRLSMCDLIGPSLLPLEVGNGCRWGTETEEGVIWPHPDRRAFDCSTSHCPLAPPVFHMLH